MACGHFLLTIDFCQNGAVRFAQNIVLSLQLGKFVKLMSNLFL